MDLNHCPYCGKQLDSPPQRPPGCKCDPMEWYPNEIPPPCDRYEKVPFHDMCRHCEHDRECHESERCK